MANFFRRLFDAFRGQSSEAARMRAETERLQRRIADVMLEHRRMSSRVDAADDGEFDRRLWERADALGPNAAFSEGVRAKLRSRGRHEALNNNYARGLVRTHANDLVGTCPRLQLTIPGDTSGEMAKRVERSFTRWTKAAGIGHKFRLMEKANGRDGEIFATFTTTPNIRHAVKLNIRLIEAEQCQSPWDSPADPLLIDGIRFDESGEPVEYYFLRYHPGESYTAGLLTASQFLPPVPANRVLHWREQDRAGQVRGVPRITAALPLFAQQRRYTLAVITAAEFASMIAGVMKTQQAPGDGAASISNWSMFEIIKGALLSLPAGWEASPFKSDQPTTTYPDFKREILNEAGAGTGTPLNVVSGNSSGYNFSSGRLDHVPYRRGKKIERYDFENVVVDPIFVEFEREARMVGEVPSEAPPIEEWTVTWNYDGFGAIDEQKDAAANDTCIKNGTSTLKEILAEHGQDVYEHMDQLAKERDYAASKGLPWPMLFSGPAVAAGESSDEEEAVETEDVTEARLRAAMEESGVPSMVADLVVDAIYPAGPKRRPTFSRNGHGKGVAR